MGRKIFVSYKYADCDVKNLTVYDNSSVRDYVDEFEKLIDTTDHIYKGESDGEDLSVLSDDTIWEKLKDRIYDSTLTIVFISPGMKEAWRSDKDQWIPWEISYSLKEISRRDKNGNKITSKTNAMLAVVLPDSSGSYSYYLESKTCCASSCTMHHTDRLFKIIKENKFNKVNADKRTCSTNNSTIYTGTCSYIEAVKWSSFKNSINTYIDAAYNRQNDIASYSVYKEVE